MTERSAKSLSRELTLQIWIAVALAFMLMLSGNYFAIRREWQIHGGGVPYTSLHSFTFGWLSVCLVALSSARLAKKFQCNFLIVIVIAASTILAAFNFLAPLGSL